MFNQALNINKSQDNKKSNELTEEDYDLINKDISKALSDMKKDNKDQDEDNNNNEENENEDDLAYFDKDFFTDSSNSISHDNFSDISENSFKSANIGMRNNYIKNVEIYSSLLISLIVKQIGSLVTFLGILFRSKNFSSLLSSSFLKIISVI